MNYILFDDENRDHLLPLTFLRPVANIRCGILTFSERWNKLLNAECGIYTSKYLRKKFPFQWSNVNVFINGTLIPENEFIEAIKTLQSGHALVSDKGLILAFAADSEVISGLRLEEKDYIDKNSLQNLKQHIYTDHFLHISRPWQIFTLNDETIRRDFAFLTKNRVSAPLSDTNKVTGIENIFIEEGAVAEFSTINAKTGPVYVAKNAEIMENCAIRGPFVLGDHSVLKMGAKIYGPTTIGPHCKVGGEVNNSVFFGFSNKAHDGFLGNSVIAEWCNLGADTNNSNLKNTYEIVRLWSYPQKQFASTGLQFCGLIMGDHSKSAINTMFNTGTVVGISANIFGEGFPRNYIPSFSWGGASGFQKYNFAKAVEVARRVCERRNVILSDIDLEIFETLYALSY